ncbi:MULTISPECIES: TIGR02530 family flagellar biosynthesis protein [Brevibacillus]|jgi:flagellar operon protein|uniref:Flagellar operon protein n=2 Tax=Brevibacillus TaxID=55080 RepID=A0A1I3NQE6_9BACL|nr:MULTISPECIES: TIGR02530 family flagellar biosynthesis protein [Brevibacillus]MEC2128443.1 TIGR02530 family flagellar biosynthesis protein [Brevibacillus centrosporus]MED4909866.1 TIGR02530 family flagellar biosynthesis protein [Brevibacillus centrosporus]RNB73715.1 flagellar protein [Brevibacillus centrosporus]RNB88108.1 flagellar protein [Brevibacillus nitrificans]SFJ11484.1 flagellar operon protein [Brevibacillus centrosporus]
MNPFHVSQTYFPPKTNHVTKPTAQIAQGSGKSFQQFLTESLGSQAKTQPLGISQHAVNRLKERGITLDAPQMERLETAVQKAASKGAKESLILMDNVAYVVSIVNRKIITAVDDGSMKDNVFTNIDSAIFV